MFVVFVVISTKLNKKKKLKPPTIQYEQCLCMRCGLKNQGQKLTSSSLNCYVCVLVCAFTKAGL